MAESKGCKGSGKDGLFKTTSGLASQINRWNLKVGPPKH
jgi:hypothetical protein